MTTDELAIEDVVTAARLDWLDAEARLVELLPPATSTASDGAPDPEEFTAALAQAEQAHQAYMAALRRWAGLSAR